MPFRVFDLLIRRFACLALVCALNKFFPDLSPHPSGIIGGGVAAIRGHRVDLSRDGRPPSPESKLRTARAVNQGRELDATIIMAHCSKHHHRYRVNHLGT